MHPIEQLDEAQSILDRLIARDPALVVCLPRQPGTKEARYSHLLSGEPVIEERRVEAPVEPARLAVQAEDARIAALEKKVAELRSEVQVLRDELAAFRRQFE